MPVVAVASVVVSAGHTTCVVPATPGTGSVPVVQVTPPGWSVPAPGIVQVMPTVVDPTFAQVIVYWRVMPGLDGTLPPPGRPVSESTTPLLTNTR